MTTSSPFLELHRPGEPLILPNAWDAGSARLFAHLGFSALATTSSGFAATLGRIDGQVTRDEVLAHARALVEATALPVSADLEAGFARTPEGVAETYRLAVETGLAGGSIEDYEGEATPMILALGEARERVLAAVEAARAADSAWVLTARAENFLRGRPDLADTIERLQAYQEAGADVLYAPGLRTLEDIRAVVGAVDRPVNVLLAPGGPSVAELAAAGVARISIGGNLQLVALGAVTRAARGLLEGDTADLWETAQVGREMRAAAYAEST